jgi:hypothetical protein
MIRAKIAATLTEMDRNQLKLLYSQVITTSERPLNEFGMIYVDLFIGGNYARYYPDF